MNSQFQQLFDQFYEQFRGAARFRWQAMIVAWVVCFVGWVGVVLQPNVYRAQARVYVDSRTSLAPVLQGLTINQDVNAQLNLVRQSLLGSTQLERVAREADLEVQASTPQEKAKMLEKVRENVKLESVILDGKDSSGGTVYTIAYESPKRDTSLKVVDILLNSFVEETLGGKRAGTQSAQQFLRDQIQEYEQRLRDAEQRLADFKRRNVGQMPGVQGDYFSRLQAEMQEAEKVRAQLNIATTRRDELQRQLRGEQPSSVPIASIVDPDGETATRIKETEAKLDELLLRFTDKHPDVVATRATLEQLQQRRADEIAALRRGDRGALLASGASANPVIQKVQQSLNETEVEIAALRGQVSSHERNVYDLRKLVDTVPEVEADYARLNRDYDVTRAQYSALVDRLDKANLGEQAEAAQSIRFEIIDPPSASFEPAWPNRPLLMSLVLVAGLALGGGVAYLMHMWKPVFHSSRALNEITGLPVLGVVSMTWLDRYKKHQLRGYTWFSVGIGFLLIAFFIALQLQPLGVRLAQRLIG